MPQITTRQFGVLEYDESAALEFPAGLPGFEDQTRFLLVERPAVAPVVFLQSLALPELCFIAAPMAEIEPAYELCMTPDDLLRLGFDEQRQPTAGKDVICLALLSVAEDGPLTANLLAPVVIHPRTRQAVQAVRMDARYSHQHVLNVAGGACS